MSNKNKLLKDPLIGMVLGDRYKVMEMIGVGGMGAVYRAVQTSVSRDVAIKVLLPSVTNDGTIVERFKIEAEVIGTLRHANTLTLFDMGFMDNGQLYLVTEFLKGRPLRKVVKEDGPIPVEDSISLASQICDSLEEAHGKSIVHRDLKPENIFVSAIGGQQYVRVLDFGVAKLGDGTLTVAGELFGTPAYMAPEQIRGVKEEVDHRADIYALGVVLYEMLSGSRPFTGNAPALVLTKQLNEAPAPLSTHEACKNIPPSLEALVMQMLEKPPEARPKSIVEIKTRLRSSGHDLSASHVAPKPTTPNGPSEDPSEGPSDRRTSLLKYGGIGLFVLAMLIVVVVWVMGH